MSEFLKRLTSGVWRRKYELGLQFIRWFLAVTFAAVVIATLAECQPFNHYWQVVPDPGAKCRQGYAQLITMGTSDVITDLLLVAFPIPIVLKSHMAAKRKVSLILLFSLSLILIGITIYRVVEVVHRHSDQQFRSLLASLEILAAAAVSNALVLGSFVRDRGVKKQRYRIGSVGGNSSLDRAGTNPRPRTLTIQAWGSDASLAGDLCMRMGPDLEKEQCGPAKARPAPMALPAATHAKTLTPDGAHGNRDLPSKSKGTDTWDRSNSSADAEDQCPSRGEAEVTTPRRASFFDVGGLLEQDEISPGKRRAYERSIPEIFPAPLPPAMPHALSRELSVPETNRRGSSAFMSDMEGLQSSQKQPSPVVRNFSRPTSPTLPSPQHMPTKQRSPNAPAPSQISGSSGESTKVKNPPSSQLQDIGGLLN